MARKVQPKADGKTIFNAKNTGKKAICMTHGIIEKGGTGLVTRAELIVHGSILEEVKVGAK